MRERSLLRTTSVIGGSLSLGSLQEGQNVVQPYCKSVLSNEYSLVAMQVLWWECLLRSFHIYEALFGMNENENENESESER